jgi:hypothetical protein
MRGPRALLGVALVAALVAPASAGTSPASRAPVPGTNCSVFPADNVWNMDVSKLPVHRKSKIWKRAMHAGSTNLHPDFGPPGYGIPFNVVTNAHATTSVRFTYASESDPGPYPFGSDTTIEDGSDAHALMVNGDTCTLYELFAAHRGSPPHAGSGAVFDLGSNALRKAGWTSADAAGLPIFPGLVRWDEVQAGAMHHAIRFTADCTSRHYLWPARHQAGVADASCPPMGARFRLKAGFKLTGFSKDARVILTAMKHYGLILADNGSDWYFQGEVNPAWTYPLMDALKRVPAGAFVAVDESACKVGSNTGVFAYGPGCPRP